MTATLEAIYPDWKVPDYVQAMVTLRSGGYSRGVFQGCNLATHVGDQEEVVKKNRGLLKKQFKLPSEPYWLKQTHSSKVIELGSAMLRECDAVWTNNFDTICAVLTADCLPVFFYHSTQNRIAVAHAGWRGLLGGILEETVHSMTSSVGQLQVWLGPAIGAEKFVVGEEVRTAFCKTDPGDVVCFKSSVDHNREQMLGYYSADLYGLAKRRLHNIGVKNITGGEHCTVTEPERFFSFRRDGKTGRMANLIWLAE